MLPSNDEFLAITDILSKLKNEIAEHELTKQKLCQVNLELAAILKLIPDAYLRLNLEGIVLDYQHGSTDSPLDIVPGKPILEYLPQHIREDFKQAIAQSLQTQLPVNFTEPFTLSNSIGQFVARLLSLQSKEIIVLIRPVETQILFKYPQFQDTIRFAEFRAEVDTFLAQSVSLQEMMQGCTEAMVKHLNAAFARIWTLNKQENVLELQVSSGMYTHIDGPHKLVPVGQFKIGLIAQESKPHLTNSVQTDPRVGNKEWAAQEGMIAFAGYPLIVEGETLGVMAMFSRQPLNESIFEALRIAAYEIAIGIKRKQTEAALRQSEAKFREAAQTAQEKAQQLEAALLELQQTQVQLIHSEKMSSLGQLVAGIAHEINNPVNFIYGNINHAREYVRDLLYLVELYQQHYCPPVPEIHEQIYMMDLDFLTQDLPKVLDSMNMGAERIRQIVLSLRNFSRLDEEGMKRVDIHEGIDSTLLLLQNRLKVKPGSSEIQVIKEYGNLPKIVCHAGQMNQVFMNLLTNAIDALEESMVNSQESTVNNHELWNQPQILIRTELTADQQVMIRIVDNGPGMTEEVRSRLFDPFFTTKPVGKGTGMGLSISYQIIVNKHHGKLECISAPGKGAEFVITIPLLELPN